MVQWLRLHASSAGDVVQSLCGELRLHEAHCEAKNKQTNKLPIDYVVYHLESPSSLPGAVLYGFDLLFFLTFTTD